MKRLAIVALLALLVAPTSAWAAPVRAVGRPSALRAPSGAESVGVIVRFKDPTTAPLGAKLLSEVTSTSAAPINHAHGYYSFTSPETATDSQYAIQLMLAAPGIDYAEPNYLNHVMSYTPPTDPDFTDTATWAELDAQDNPVNFFLGGKHWWLDAMNASGAWALGQGNAYPTHGSASDVKVGVLDVGMYLNHPEFSGGTLTSGIDECASFNPNTSVLTTDTDVTPDPPGDPLIQSHGTATSAAVGAEVNGVGMVGVGWNPQIVGYKVEGPQTTDGTLIIPDSAIINAIYDATNAGCKVLNMSFGGTSYSQAEQDAVNYAHSHGVILCASAGNDGPQHPTTVEYPAGDANVVAVAALTRVGGNSTTNGTLTRASFSDDASGVNDLSAPGELFWTAYNPNLAGPEGVTGYTFWDGTSFSSPSVAGAAAYLWRAMPDLTNDQIVTYLENTATHMGTGGAGTRNDQYGYGLVNLQAAYNQLITDYPMLAKPTIAATYVKPSATVTWTASAGYNVGYQVSLDGSQVSSQTGTSYVLPGPADGPHLISVLPTSTRNWNTSSLATKTITVDSIAPVVNNFSLGGTTLSWSVTELNPYTVQAYVDAATPVSAPGNTLSASSLAPGSHTLYVNATDAAGNSSGWVSWPFTMPLQAPVVPSTVVTDALSATVTWPAVPGTTSYDYTVNGGSTQSTVGPAFALTGLTGGVTQLQVRSVDGTLTSTWATATVTDNVVVPGTPAISAPATVGVPSVSISWPAAPHALSYEWRLNGGASTATAATNATIAGLDLGANSVSVRSLDNLAQSAWATATVTYVVPAPVISAPATVWATTATVTWSAVTGATSYDYSLDNAPPSSTASTGTLVSGLTYGPHTFEVRALQGPNASAWATATITYAMPATTALTLSPSATTVVQPDSSTTLYGLISAPGETFRLQSSPDGTTWTDTGLSATSTSTPAPQPFVPSVTATTYFRLVFDGDAHWAPAASNIATVTYLLAIDPPVLSDVVVNDALSANFSWPPATGATSYDYTVNGGSIQSTSGPAFVLSGLTGGVTHLQVRTVAGSRSSVWSTATVTDNVIVPGTPVISPPGTVYAPSVSVSWPPATDALSYEWRLNGGASTPTNATAAVVTGLGLGANSGSVRSLDNLAQSGWATATVTYALPSQTILALSPVSSKVAYPNVAASLTGSVNAPGAHVVLESSFDGISWTPTSAGWTSTSTPGPVPLSASVTRTTYFRLTFAGSTGWTAATSNSIVVNYAASVRGMTAPSSVKRKAKFTVSDTIVAPSPAPASAVLFKFYLRKKSGRHYVWVLKKTATAGSLRVSGQTATYVLRTSLSTAGPYHVRVVFSGGGLYAAGQTSSLNLRVK